MQGSEEPEQPLDELRASQVRELAASFALTSMEFALAQEKLQVGAAMREAGILFDPLTFVALADNGSLERSVKLANDWLEDEAA